MRNSDQKNRISRGLDYFPLSQIATGFLFEIKLLPLLLLLLNLWYCSVCEGGYRRELHSNVEHENYERLSGKTTQLTEVRASVQFHFPDYCLSRILSICGLLENLSAFKKMDFYAKHSKANPSELKIAAVISFINKLLLSWAKLSSR